MCASSAPGVSPCAWRNRPSGRPGSLACPCPRAFRHSRSDPRLAAPARLPLLPSVASPPFSGRGLHLGAVPAAGTRTVSKRDRAPAGVRRHRPWSIRRPAHLGCRTDLPGRLSCGIRSHPFDACRPRRAVRGCRPPDHPAAAFGAGHDTQAVVASPLRFSCLAPRKGDVTRARLSSRGKQVEAPPVRVIRGWCSSNSARSGPAPGLFSRPHRGGFRLPGGVRGICSTLRSVCPTPRVSAPRRRLGPTCRFVARSTASSIVAGRRFLRRVEGPLGRGSWALAPGVSRAVSSWRPRHGFVNRVDRALRPGLPWVLLSSLRCSVAGLWPPLPVACRPWGSRLVRRDVICRCDRSTSRWRVVPSAL